MAEEGQVIKAPDGAHSLRLVRIEPDLLEMEADYAGSPNMPPMHLHPSQEERFEVLEGALLTVVDGEERRYEVGDSFTVPPGTPHQMRGDGPARFRWEVRPALRTAEFFERLYSGNPGETFLEDFAPEFRLA